MLTQNNEWKYINMSLNTSK